MRSFLRGSLYGVTATSQWIGPQQQQQQQTSTATHVHPQAVAPVNAAPNGVRAAHAMVAPVIQANMFATQHSYGGFPFYGSAVSASETAARRAEQSIRGKVTKWFDSRGFGFIVDMEGGQQYFVHARDLITVEGGNRCLFAGQTVEFECQNTDSGQHAIRVSGPNGSPLQSGFPTTMTSSSSMSGNNSMSSSSMMMAMGQQTDSAASASAAPPSYESATSMMATPTTSNTAAMMSLPTGTDPLAESTSSASAVASGESAGHIQVALPQPRVVGVIAHWTFDKGYGFVAVRGQDTQYFTHIKDFTCERPHMSPSMPTAGLEVEFTPSNAGGKKRATHVTLPNGTPFAPNVANTAAIAAADNAAAAAAAAASSSSSVATPNRSFMQQHRNPAAAVAAAAAAAASPNRHNAHHNRPPALALAFAPEKYQKTVWGKLTSFDGLHGTVHVENSNSDIKFEKQSLTNKQLPSSLSVGDFVELKVDDDGNATSIAPSTPSATTNFSNSNSNSGSVPATTPMASATNANGEVASMWHAGYSTGFVDGQHYLKSEIASIHTAQPSAVPPLPRSHQTQSNAQQIAAAAKAAGMRVVKVVTTEVPSTHAASTTTRTTTTNAGRQQQQQQQQQQARRSPSPAAAMAEEQQLRSGPRSPVIGEEEKSSHKMSTSSSSSRNHGATPQHHQQQQMMRRRSSSPAFQSPRTHQRRTSSPPAAATSTLTPQSAAATLASAAVAPAAVPMWASSAGSWGSTAATTPTNNVTATPANSPATTPIAAQEEQSNNSSSNNNSTATAATTTQQQDQSATNTNATTTASGGGFPSFPQRGGFGSFGRGSMLTGRGHRGRGW